MDKHNAKACLPLVQALAEGKTIQLKWEDETWVDIPNPDFTGDIAKYRVKPQRSENKSRFNNFKINTPLSIIIIMQVIPGIIAYWMRINALGMEQLINEAPFHLVLILSVLVFNLGLVYIISVLEE